MKRRRLNVFSLSFLDCICCGLGAVILLFVLVNAKSAIRRDEITSELHAHVSRLAAAVSEGRKTLVTARNSLEIVDSQLETTRGLSRRLIKKTVEKETELADSDRQTLATRAHAEKLKSDLKTVEEELKRLKAGAEKRVEAGDRLRKFPGHGDRQYLTDLKMGGQRTLLLVDASASMLDQSIVGVLRRRHLPVEEKIKSAKWQQAVATVDWLITRLPTTGKFQAYAFNETAEPLIEGTRGSWLDGGNVDRLNAAVDRMRRFTPQKGTSLLKAFEAASGLRPPPDNIFLLTDGLPTMGAKKPWRKRISGKQRLQLYHTAIQRLPAGIPVNIILYPMEGDPLAADAFWQLAKRTGGAFFCPSGDWP